MGRYQLRNMIFCRLSRDWISVFETCMRLIMISSHTFVYFKGIPNFCTKVQKLGILRKVWASLTLSLRGMCLVDFVTCTWILTGLNLWRFDMISAVSCNIILFAVVVGTDRWRLSLIALAKCSHIEKLCSAVSYLKLLFFCPLDPLYCFTYQFKFVGLCLWWCFLSTVQSCSTIQVDSSFRHPARLRKKVLWKTLHNKFLLF